MTEHSRTWATITAENKRMERKMFGAGVTLISIFLVALFA